MQYNISMVKHFAEGVICYATYYNQFIADDYVFIK